MMDATPTCLTLRLAMDEQYAPAGASVKTSAVSRLLVTVMGDPPKNDNDSIRFGQFGAVNSAMFVSRTVTDLISNIFGDGRINSVSIVDYLCDFVWLAICLNICVLIVILCK